MGKRKDFDTLDTAAPAGGPGVSDTLREARQSLGYELRDVATMLRIRYPYLKAIEDGRFEELPGTAYAAGFLRSYAEYLGLEPETIIARYKEEAAGNARKQELYFPTPVPEGRVPGGTVLLGTLVLASIVYGGWYYLSATDRSMVDLVPTLPDRLVSLLDNLPFSSTAQPPSSESPASVTTAEAPPAPAPVQTAAVPPPPPGGASTAVAPPSPPPAPSPAPLAAPPAAPVAAAPAAPPPAPAATAKPVAVPPPPASKPIPAPAATPVPPPAPAAQPANSLPASPPEEDEPEGATQEPTPLSPGATALAAAPPAPAPRAAEQAGLPSKVYGSQNQNSRIQLRATQESWIQVRDGNGEIIFTRVLKPGDVFRVPDRAGIRVRTGNAGGLTVVTDGIEGAPLGAIGQVLRDVALDAHTPTLRGNGSH